MGDRQEFLPPRAPGAEPPGRWDQGDQAQPAEPPRAVSPPPEPSHAHGQVNNPFGPTMTTNPTPAAQPMATAPPAGPSRTALAGNGIAVAAMVLAVAGLVALLFGAGAFFFINLPCSISAWVLGRNAKRKVDRGETSEHRSMAHAAQVMGIIGTVLGVLAVVAWVVALATSEQLRDEIRKAVDDNRNGLIRLTS